MLRDVPADRADREAVDERFDRERGLDEVESWGTMAGGLLLVVLGLMRRSWLGYLGAAVGAGLVYRRAQQEGLLDGDLKRRALHTRARHEVEIERSIIVEKPVEEVFHFWRDLGNLPHFMHLVDSVVVMDDTHSRWSARVPGLGMQIHWDAETTRDRENELLAWRSMPGSELVNEGTIRFRPADDGRHTRVTAHVAWRAPGGRTGARLMEFFRNVPANTLEDDLVRMKELLETGRTQEQTVTADLNREIELPDGGGE